jgi:hypothetical protein
MRLLETVDDAHVTAAFLRAELDSERFGDELRVSLGSRLDGLAWRRAVLNRDEVLAIRYVAWDYWLEVSDGTRLPAVAAVLFRGRGGDASYEEVDPGAAPLIAVRADANAPIVVVEGHVRLTAYALFPERLPQELEILLGEGGSLRDWDMYA